jgi:AcrR family transcriptional regulator
MNAPARTARGPAQKGRKYDQVLEGARRVFMADGYEGASVDAIAREAGVSKATLYSYFADKRLLFMEVARTECARQAEESLQLIDLSAPPRTVLRLAAERMLGFILSDFGQRVFRICVAEADRFPELGREFYQSGPALVRERMTEYLRGAAARGELAIEDYDLAADQFAELCKADLWPRLVFGIDRRFPDTEVARVIDGAVETFMARYGRGDFSYEKSPR